MTDDLSPAQRALMESTGRRRAAFSGRGGLTRGGKSEVFRTTLMAMVKAGKRVLVVGLDGSIDGAEWLAKRTWRTRLAWRLAGALGWR